MYRLTTLAAVFAAMLHGIAFVLGQFAADVQMHLAFVVFYLLMAVFLFQQKRRAVWPVFFVALAGLVVAFMGTNSGSTAPDSVFYAIAVMSVVVAACAFIILWKSAPKSKHVA